LILRDNYICLPLPFKTKKMAGSLNKVMLIGNLGDNVEMKYFDNGGCIGKFPIATSSAYTNKSTGERVEKTEWHQIIVRNKGAEICEKYLSKGDKVFVEGSIETRKWKDQNGEDQYTTQIQCRDFTFLTPKGQSGANTGNPQPQAQQNQTPKQPSPAQSQPAQNQASKPSPTEEKEDDLPF
jgi:single-strand DNA-binding protein